MFGRYLRRADALDRARVCLSHLFLGMNEFLFFFLEDTLTLHRRIRRGILHRLIKALSRYIERLSENARLFLLWGHARSIEL